MDSNDEMMVQQVMQEEVEVADESKKSLLLIVSPLRLWVKLLLPRTDSSVTVCLDVCFRAWY
jgi:hypothetical protein